MNALGTGAGAPDGGVGRDPPGQARLGQLAEEQAALRRVATLAAQATAPEEVFAAVAEEVGQLLRADLANLFRYEPGPTETSVAAWGTAGRRFPVGSQWPLEGYNLSTLVFETSRPVRIDRYADSSSGPLGAAVRETGVRSAVGTPILAAVNSPRGHLCWTLPAGHGRGPVCETCGIVVSICRTAVSEMTSVWCGTSPGNRTKSPRDTLTCSPAGPMLRFPLMT